VGCTRTHSPGQSERALVQLPCEPGANARCGPGDATRFWSEAQSEAQASAGRAQVLPLPFPAPVPQVTTDTMAEAPAVLTQGALQVR